MKKSQSNSNIYLDVMTKTIQNVYQTCKTVEDKCALDLLGELWRTKMRNVICATIGTDINENNCKNGKAGRKPGKIIKKKPKCEKLKESNCTFVSSDNSTNPCSRNMPCLICDKLSESCYHPTPVIELNSYEPLPSPKFQKIKLLRPVTIKEKTKPIQITLPARFKNATENRTCKLYVPVSLRSSLKSILIPVISKIGRFSTSRAAVMLQNHVNVTYSKMNVAQLDGASDDVHCKIRIIRKDSVNSVKKKLSCSDIDSDDDLTDDENPDEAFLCNNIILCQADIVKHKGNIWRINLKHGVMHICGKDYVFSKADCVTKF